MVHAGHLWDLLGKLHNCTLLYIADVIDLIGKQKICAEVEQKPRGVGSDPRKKYIFTFQGIFSCHVLNDMSS